MTGLALSFPDETPRERATTVAEWLLAALHKRDATPVYVSKLGHYSTVFEVRYIERTGTPYIDIELTSVDRAHQPDVIRQALVDIVEAHPTRTAYQTGRRTKKVYGWRADPATDEVAQQIVSRVLDDCLEQDSKTLRATLKQARPLPWE